jgi:MFS family permease
MMLSQVLESSPTLQKSLSGQEILVSPHPQLLHSRKTFNVIAVASFFFTQFLTSLLWVRVSRLKYSLKKRLIYHIIQATVAERYGQRFVLFSFLLGSSITCLLFGTCTSIAEAIAIRLLQGVFGGAIGVARGTVTIITDPTNEGRAYAILGSVFLPLERIYGLTCFHSGSAGALVVLLELSSVVHVRCLLSN